MSDLISRHDAIEAVTRLCVDGYKAKVDGCFIPLTDALINTLSALPSADQPKGNSSEKEKSIEQFLTLLTINALSDSQGTDRQTDEPETEPAPVVAYICDRRRCAICSGEDGGCDHTTDIKHAARFKNVAGQYFERPYIEEEKDDE